MPQFRVLSRSTRERIYVDKIDPKIHLHISGSEFNNSTIKDISEKNGSNTFKKEEPEPKKETVIEEVIADVKKEEKKGKSKK